jgi:hypothetical protein
MTDQTDGLEEYLEFLERLSDQPVPELLRTANDRVAVQRWVQAVLDNERAGMDRMFESISHTLRFIPNVIINAITVKYIAAPIAARITAKLSLKQAASLADGLPTEYIGEAAVHLEPRLAAELLSAMKPKRAEPVIRRLMTLHPLKLLDVFSFADAALFELVRPEPSFLQNSEAGMSRARQQVLARFRGG